MNYLIVLTMQAKEDLNEIFKYIAVQLKSVQNAFGQLERLEKAISSLDQMPERFCLYDKPKWEKRNLHVMPVDHYLVFYIPNHERCTVTVIRIVYGGRNIDRQLNEYSQDFANG